MAQWLRICLPMQGTWVRALVWEDPTCRGAAGPVTQLLSLRVWSLCSTTREAVTVRGPRTAMKSGPRSLQLEQALAQKRRPNTAINKLKINKKSERFKKKKNIHRNIKMSNAKRQLDLINICEMLLRKIYTPKCLY